MRTYKVYGDNTDGFNMLQPPWILITTIRAESRTIALTNAYKKIKIGGWDREDIKVKLIRKKK